MLTDWIETGIDNLARFFPPGSFFSYEMNIYAFIAVVLVALICGSVGSLVVSNRMAFFSDALAHCTFAGVALGLLTGVITGAVKSEAFLRWGLPAIMVGFGI